jgi:putative transposase
LPDRRPAAVRPKPHNALTEPERQAIVEVCNQPEYASLPPSQIVPKLMDQGHYLGSESSFYRVLKAANQQHHRGRSKAPAKRPITPHTATAPNQVWCWDISYCASTVKGRYWYLYLIMDLFSRKIVGWEIHDRESGDLARELVSRTVMREHCAGQPLVLHSDNGSPMKASTLKAKLDELGIRSSHSRPRVSNDNAYSESLFRTLKYCPQWPSGGFATLKDARQWMLTFSCYYNEEHRHSGIRFVTPDQRHQG